MHKTCFSLLKKAMSSQSNRPLDWWRFSNLIVALKTVD